MAQIVVSSWAAKTRLSLGFSCVLTLCGAAAWAQDPSQPADSSAAVSAPQPLPQPAPLALAPAPLPPTTTIVQPGVTPPPIGQARYGFLVMGSFGIKPVATATPGFAGQSTAVVSSTMQGGVALGFKAGRTMFSVGFDLTSIDQRSSAMYARDTSFLVTPALQIALVRSRDQRVELVASLRAGAGTTTSNDTTSGSPRPVLTMYELAPAVRFWAHKQFAIQGLAGYTGNYIIYRGTSSASLGVHSALAAIGTLGVF